jgi:hypothetical protein
MSMIEKLTRAMGNASDQNAHHQPIHIHENAGAGTRLPANELIQPPLKALATKCSGCSVGLQEDQIKRCAKCKSVFYCSRDCQVKDWSAHKLACKELRKQLILNPQICHSVLELSKSLIWKAVAAFFGAVGGGGGRRRILGNRAFLKGRHW